MEQKKWEDMSNKERAQGCSILIVLVIVCIIFLKTCFGGEEKPEVVKQKSIDDLKRSAYIFSQTFVERQLKAPGSAKFPYMDEADVRHQGGDTFSVVSYVDAQNSFGALLRNKYVCKLRVFADGDSSELIFVELY